MPSELLELRLWSVAPTSLKRRKSQRQKRKENMKSTPAIIGSPNTETAVYLLLGILWDYIPNKFSFEEFEVSPRKQKYGHTKHLDARGKELIDGKWVDVNFEFKLNSKSLLCDVKKHPEFYATWLICWRHDSPNAEEYVERVLCLEDVFNKLDENEKYQILRKTKDATAVISTLPKSDTSQPPFKHSHPALIGTPSAETAVYFLLGMMWNYIGYQFCFEEFEPSPKKNNYNHTKILDARGIEFIDGQWTDVNFEFKLKSSGIFGDLKNHPTFNATWVICWQHDALSAIMQYVERVLSLEDIYCKLPTHEKNRLISNPDQIVKIVGVKTSVPELVDRFSSVNRGKVKHFIDMWKHQIQGGTSEIILLHDSESKVRLVANSSEHVLIKAVVPIELRQLLVQNYAAEEMEVNDKLKLLLSNLDIPTIETIMETITSKANQIVTPTSVQQTIHASIKSELKQKTNIDDIDMAIVEKFKYLGLNRQKNCDVPGTPVIIKWLYGKHVVELRYRYKMGWSFEGYYLNGELINIPKGFGSRDKARNYYLNDAYSRITNQKI